MTLYALLHWLSADTLHICAVAYLFFFLRRVKKSHVCLTNLANNHLDLNNKKVRVTTWGHNIKKQQFQNICGLQKWTLPTFMSQIRFEHQGNPRACSCLNANENIIRVRIPWKHSVVKQSLVKQQLMCWNSDRLNHNVPDSLWGCFYPDL